MKAKVLQIVWHGKEPVYSLDFHPDGTLATAGADKEIKVYSCKLLASLSKRPHSSTACLGAMVI